MRSLALTSVLRIATLALSGCAGSVLAIPPAVPASLNPPIGQEAFVEAFASGVQIYECSDVPGRPGGYEWAFRAPEATLADASGRVIGKHYGGPTWEATDGSSVVGEVQARDPGPSATAIPWLLLRAKSAAGSGAFSATKYVQRVSTVGGLAPEGGCGAANVKQIARVPYTATYTFYRAR